ncbi:MAG: hypothetical protein Q8P41_22885 [Pseudomonadota bacterium]|nr:hypothetical protein [Pseudomonadota bacterium]
MSLLLPTADEQQWALAALGDLVRRRGVDPLLTRPLVLPAPAFFPDPWTPDEAGVERILRRLLAYAGLPDARVRAEVDREPDTTIAGWSGAAARHRNGAAGWYMGRDGGTYEFGVDANFNHRPESLVAVLAHETAHAWRDTVGVQQDNRDAEELLTDLTTVYLGFGVLTTNAAWQFRGVSDGLASGWEKQQAGYLDFRTFAFLLALLAHARKLGWWERTRLAWNLSPNQRAAFRVSYNRITLDRAEMLQEIGVRPE